MPCRAGISQSIRGRRRSRTSRLSTARRCNKRLASAARQRVALDRRHVRKKEMTGETPDRMTVFLELSHTLETGMPVYPGHAVVELLLAEAEPPRQLMHLHAGTHSGTHIDAARHFVPSGRTVDEYPIDRFVLPAVVLPVRASEDEEIGWAALASSLAAVPPGAAVLLNTGWD